MNNVSVLFPYRDSQDGWRDVLFKWVANYYRHILPEAEICVGDSPGPFNRSRACNLAFGQSGGKWLVIADADTVVQPYRLWQALDQLGEGASGAWLPYDRYLRLTPGSTNQLLAQSPTCPLPQDADCEQIFPSEATPLPAVSGCVVMSRTLYEDIGGFNEQYEGWGYEDRDLALRLEARSALRRLPGNCWHLWHPEAAPAPTKRNRQLYESTKQCLFRLAAADR